MRAPLIVGIPPVLRTVALTVALLALAACEPKVVTYRVQLSAVSCTQPQPLDGVQLLRFKITGDGLAAPIESDAILSSKAVEIPAIPAGRNRVIEVRAYAGDVVVPGGVVAIGRSAPFDVPEVLPAERVVTLNLFLRRANAFSKPSDAASPTDCQRMRSARAGHTATLLPDGKVFIAGGFQTTSMALPDGGIATVRTTLQSTEIFDPETGGFREAQPMGVKNKESEFVPLPRAFHTGTLLSTGQVLLAGGEVVANGTTFATRSALVFDYPPRTNSPPYGSYQLSEGRMRHAAAHDGDAGVLLVGGVGNDGGVVETLEWYESLTGKHAAVPTPVKRVGMSVTTVQNGKSIAVAGGTDGENVKDDVLFFTFDPGQGTFVQEPNRVRLNRLRRAAGVAGFADSSRFLLVGGYSTPNDAAGVQPVNTSEIVKTDDSKVLEGPNVGSARGDICAALLPDGRVLAIGGRTGELGLGSRSDDSVELISLEAGGRATLLGLEKLTPGRYWHTCTTLKDGSVLVLGGLRETTAGAQEVLQDAWIFTPAPLDVVPN